VRATGVQSSDGTVKEVVLGVDTHLDVHVAVALDRLGRHMGESKIPTTLRGYGQLVRWAQGFGVVRCAGVEGTGSYGAGLARYLRKAGIAVFEVERPKRRHLRREGKSDSRDAEAAARAVLSGEATGVPKSGDGRVEMIRVLRTARRRRRRYTQGAGRKDLLGIGAYHKALAIRRRRETGDVEPKPIPGRPSRKGTRLKESGCQSTWRQTTTSP
jgi:transposase